MFILTSKRMVIVLIILFFIDFAFADLVRITSEYPNQDTSSPVKTVRVQGTGFIIELRDHFYVLTASHVSRGENTKIFSGDNELTILGRRYSETSDVEVFEVGNPDVPVLFTVFDDKYIILRQSLKGNVRWIDAYNYVPVPAFVKDPTQKADNAVNKLKPISLYMDFYGSLLHSNSLIQPGTSGSPLISVKPSKPINNLTPYDMREAFGELVHGQHFVRGLTIRRERFFATSSFVPEFKLLELLSNYIQKKSIDPRDASTWHANGSLLYRKFGNVDEAASLSSATSGGILVDGGNGVGMDGGDTFTLNEDSPGKFLSKVSSFPYHSGRPTSYWLGAMRDPGNGELVNFPLWFDMEHYLSLARFIMPLRPEGDVADITSQLINRFQAQKTGKFDIKTPAGAKFDGQNLFINVPLAGGDRLSFVLNRYGVPCAPGKECNGEFKSTLEMISAKKVPYIVDIRGLYFLDPANSKSLGFRDPALASGMSDEKFYEIYFNEMRKEMRMARLFYRKKLNLKTPLTSAQAKKTIVLWEAKP